MEYLFYRSPINLQSVFPVINHRLWIAWGKIYKICSSCLVCWVIFMSCGLNLATVILEEFPAICVQLNFLTDLGLLVNTGIWQKEYLCSSGAYSKTVNMVLATCWVREDPGDEKGINSPLPLTADDLSGKEKEQLVHEFVAEFILSYHGISYFAH